jgi:hypothetical protein
VSRYDSLLGQTVPLIELRVKADARRAVLPASVLAMLPADRRYVMTFVLANRKEVQVGEAGAATLLIQAASVYNCFVEVQ